MSPTRFIILAIALACLSPTAAAQDCDNDGLPDIQELGPFQSASAGVQLGAINSQLTNLFIDFSLNSASFTIEAWVYRDSATGLEEYIVFNGTEGVVNQGLVLGFRPSGQFTFAFWGNDLNTPASYPPDDQWHHWACRYDATTGFRWILRDGVEVAFDVASNFVGQGPLSIGGLPSRAGFNGTLDEIRIWSGVRSDAELLQDMFLHYEDGSIPANLLAYYRIDNTDAGFPIIQDRAGTNLIATVNGNDVNILNYAEDCNANNIPDNCDITDGTSQDCNNNGIPDECDIADGTSQDCNSNGIPDECETDCNANGIPDECDILNGTSLDCNSNGTPDECDIATGTSLDTNTNGVPDECERVHNITQDTYWPNLQLAVDQSNPEDALVLQPGQYEEFIVINNSNMTIRSTDPDDRSVVQSTTVRRFNIESSSVVTLIGLNLTDGAILLGNSTLYMKKSQIVQTNGSISIGGTTIDASSLYIEDSDFINNFYGIRIGDRVPDGAPDPILGAFTLDVKNCRFLGNSFYGIDVVGNPGVEQGFSTKIRNCLFDGNTLGDYSVDLFGTGGLNSEVANNVFNSTNPIFASPQPLTLPQNNYIRGGSIYPNNIDSGEPFFIDPDGPDNDPLTYDDNDYHLSSASQLIDAGTNTGVTATVDLDGLPRIVNGTVDIGPYEYQGPPPCQADLTNDGVLDFFDISAFLTAFSANDPIADFSDDGLFDFFDISAFLTAFSAGCP